jgi:hypothetical protein
MRPLYTFVVVVSPSDAPTAPDKPRHTAALVDDWFHAAVGALVRCKDGSWMTRPPQRCPRGHRLTVI